MKGGLSQGSRVSAPTPPAANAAAASARPPRREPRGAGQCPATPLGRLLVGMVAQGRPFVWSIFSHGPKRLTFCFQVFWATEVGWLG